MNKREANLELMTQWAEAWKTLGRWQALNRHLARDAAPVNTAWMRRSCELRGRHASFTAVSARG
jgi:hypothetical protein